MSVDWTEHLKQAELLLREAAQDAASAPNTDALLRIMISVQAAQEHATLAMAKKGP